ncbi:hypothetical protein AAC387_Pa03g2016 [Persea americana]
MYCCASYSSCNLVRPAVDKGLARLYEARNQTQQQDMPAEVKKLSTTLPTTLLTTQALAIKKLSYAELKERRDKGLCFNCDEKFGPGHRCRRLFLIEGRWPNKEDKGPRWEDEAAIEHELQQP